MIRNHLLTWMTFVPAIGMLAVALLPAGARGAIRWTAALFTAAPLALAVYLFRSFDPALAGVTDYHSFQFVEHYRWIPGFGIDYFVGVDGLSVTMVLLTALLSFLCVFASWGIDRGVKGYFAMFLLLETGMIGTFVALDLILFYVFWEIM
ncbi:MAG: NADH-quinone oxidoreductase subunit M, partial [Myxococcales bacterium]|nr:NADH-quinone oxidoreductase subunit M [Myxococcales bacterium]